MIERLKNNFVKNKIIYYSYAAAVIMYIAVMFIVPGFGVGPHAKVLMNEASLIGMMALGQTFVIISGGIDLSVPWNMTSAAILLTFLSKGEDTQLWWIIPLILVVCTCVGLLNGIGVAYLKIPPIIMTLGMNNILQGALLVILKGTPGGVAPPAIINLATGTTIGIPNLMLFWLLLAVFAVILMYYSTYGRKLYALGNNEKAAYFTGIRVKRVKMFAYMIGGLAPAIAGIMFAGRLGQSYLGMGDPYLFMTIVAVVLGGASMMGGSGSYIGTIAGTSILVILRAFLAAVNLPTSVQNILYGLVLVVAVIAIPDNSRKRI